MENREDSDSLYVATFTESYFPLRETNGVKEVPKISNVESSKIKDGVSNTIKAIIESLDNCERSTKDSDFEIDEVNFQLLVNGEGKISFLALNANYSMGTTFDIKIKRKNKCEK